MDIFCGERAQWIRALTSLTEALGLFSKPMWWCIAIIDEISFSIVKRSRTRCPSWRMGFTRRRQPLQPFKGFHYNVRFEAYNNKNSVLYWLHYDWTYFKNNRCIDDFLKPQNLLVPYQKKISKDKLKQVALSQKFTLIMQSFEILFLRIYFCPVLIMWNI